MSSCHRGTGDDKGLTEGKRTEPGALLTDENSSQRPETDISARLLEEHEALKMQNTKLLLEMNEMKGQAVQDSVRQSRPAKEERTSVRLRLQTKRYDPALSDSKAEDSDVKDIWEGLDPYARLSEVPKPVRNVTSRDRAKAYERALGRDPRAPEPNTFHGKSKHLSMFLIQCDTFVQLQPNTYQAEFQRVLAVISRFRDDAGVWITPYMDLTGRNQPLVTGRHRSLDPNT
jgi:hypothetical protein